MEIILEAAEKQKNALESLINQLKEGKQRDYVVTMVPTMSIERWNKVSQQDLYKIFVINKIGDTTFKNETFSQMINGFDVIKYVFQSWRTDYQDLLSDLRVPEEEWNTNAKRIGNYTDFIVARAGPEYVRGSDPFIDEFDRIMSRFQEIENGTDMYIMIKELIQPLHEFCRTFSNDRRTISLLNPVMQCLYAFDNHVKARKNYEEQFKSYVENLQGAANTIEEKSEALQQLVPRPFSWLAL